MKKVFELELDTPIDLVLNTKVPGKWLAIDLETGDVWRGASKYETPLLSSGQWHRASPEYIALLKKLLKKIEGSRGVVERKKNEKSYTKSRLG